MAKTFHLTIARVGENLFDGEAVSLTVPGEEGVLTVLANHEPFVTPLIPGAIRLEAADGSRKEIKVSEQGILEVSNNQATVLL